MKRILRAIWDFIKRILGIKDKKEDEIKPTPKPTPPYNKPTEYWYILKPTFEEIKHIDDEKKPKHYFSESYGNLNFFKTGDTVLDEYGRMFIIDGYVTIKPEFGEILKNLKWFS